MKVQSEWVELCLGSEGEEMIEEDFDTWKCIPFLDNKIHVIQGYFSNGMVVQKWCVPDSIKERHKNENPLLRH